MWLPPLRVLPARPLRGAAPSALSVVVAVGVLEAEEVAVGAVLRVLLEDEARVAGFAPRASAQARMTSWFVVTSVSPG
jgi:hypothetical protein